MNMAANMLGLGNAATPMGIKAMSELDKLNTEKDTASNSMCLFLAINTSSVTILPLGVIAVRASAGARGPADILLPAILATLCSTIAAIFISKLLAKRSPNPKQLSCSEIKETVSEKEHSVPENKIPLVKPGFIGKIAAYLLIAAFLVSIVYSSNSARITHSHDLKLFYSAQTNESIQVFRVVTEENNNILSWRTQTEDSSSTINIFRRVNPLLLSGDDDLNLNNQWQQINSEPLSAFAGPFTFTDSSLEADVKYQYKLVSSDENTIAYAKPVPISGVQSASTSSFIPYNPDLPLNIFIVNSMGTDTANSLTWQANLNQGDNHFHLYRKPKEAQANINDTVWKRISTTTIPQESASAETQLISFEDRNFNHGTIYQYALIISDENDHHVAGYAEIESAPKPLGFLDYVSSATGWLIPIIMGGLLLLGYLKGVKVYEVLTDGAKEGFQVAVRIIPFLVAIFVAIGMFRASGALELFTQLLSPLTRLIGMPAEVLPMALLRPLSGTGAYGYMAEIVTQAPDSFSAFISSVMQGSTETTFYVLAVYFGSIGIRKTRHALPAALSADAIGILSALFFSHIFFNM
ncbi:Spore maturation protein A-like protein [Chitinispirillum alkaliphilum]|nr:Spore maturation protein A-like protein [Chitinispirillum alkaliphilum]